MKSLKDQSYCSWCGNKVKYNENWMTECSNCGFKNYINPKPCNAIIFTDGNKVLLMKRSIDPAKGMYDLPGGFMDMTDQSMEDAMYREVEEELGLNRDQVGDIIYFSSGLSEYDWMGVTVTNVAFYYVAKLDDVENNITLDESENSDYLLVNVSELKNLELAWERDRKILYEYFGVEDA